MAYSHMAPHAPTRSHLSIQRPILLLLLLLLPPLAVAINDGTFADRLTASANATSGTVAATPLARPLAAALPTRSPLLQQSDPPTSDEYNIYLYSGIFRVIYGKNYAADSGVTQFAEALLDSVTTIADRYQTEFNFLPPVGGDHYYIDLYIGNRGARDADDGRSITIASYYAAFADQYDEGPGFMVFNPVIRDQLDLLRVTIAHELFHLIQFAYRHGNDYLDNDLWLLEATATAMEELFYPDSNDYVRFVDSWYRSIQQPLDTFNGSHEYGAALFALHLINRHGIESITSLFEHFRDQTGWQAILEESLGSGYGTTLDNFYADFAAAVRSPALHFDDGAEFASDDLDYADLSSESINLKQYGLYYLRPTTNTQLAWGESAVSYWIDTQAANCFTTDQGLDCLAGSEVALFTSDELAAVAIGDGSGISEQLLTLQSGWNLVTISVNETRPVSTLFGDGRVSRIFYYQPASGWQTIRDITTSEVTLPTLQGIWLLATEPQTLTLSGVIAETTLPPLSSGWNLIGAAIPLSREALTQAVTAAGYTPNRLFTYDSGGWSLYDFIYQRGSLDNLPLGRGFWLQLE